MNSSNIVFGQHNYYISKKGEKAIEGMIEAFKESGFDPLFPLTAPINCCMNETEAYMLVIGILMHSSASKKIKKHGDVLFFMGVSIMEIVFFPTKSRRYQL